eukprot:139315-Prymnesium_polylepis.1
MVCAFELARGVPEVVKPRLISQVRSTRPRRRKRSCHKPIRSVATPSQHLPVPSVSGKLLSGNI